MGARRACPALADEAAPSSAMSEMWYRYALEGQEMEYVVIALSDNVLTLRQP